MRREHFLEALFLNEGSEAIAKDETVLWEGRPSTLAFARSVLHVRTVMGYFAVLAAWNLAAAHADGFRANAALVSAAWVVVPALVAALVIYVMAWLMASTTHYTITDKRVIMQIGVALPIALDRVESRGAFHDLARRARAPLLVVYGAETPPKSRAEIEALGDLPNVRLERLPHGKLAVHEEFPDEVAALVLPFLEAD